MRISPVAVAHRIGADAYPGTFVSVFLGQHGGGHEGRGGVSGREGVAVRAVGARHVGGLFERIDDAAHQ